MCCYTALVEWIAWTFSGCQLMLSEKLVVYKGSKAVEVEEGRLIESKIVVDGWKNPGYGSISHSLQKFQGLAIPM